MGTNSLRFRCMVFYSPMFPRQPEAKVTEGVSIDDYSTWRATRFADPEQTG